LFDLRGRHRDWGWCSRGDACHVGARSRCGDSSDAGSRNRTSGNAAPHSPPGNTAGSACRNTGEVIVSGADAFDGAACGPTAGATAHNDAARGTADDHSAERDGPGCSGGAYSPSAGNGDARDHAGFFTSTVGSRASGRAPCNADARCTAAARGAAARTSASGRGDACRGRASAREAGSTSRAASSARGTCIAAGTAACGGGACGSTSGRGARCRRETSAESVSR
jgi:hypothetical protein